jgi:hypothetical protein
MATLVSVYVTEDDNRRESQHRETASCEESGPGGFGLSGQRIGEEAVGRFVPADPGVRLVCAGRRSSSDHVLDAWAHRQEATPGYWCAFRETRSRGESPSLSAPRLVEQVPAGRARAPRARCPQRGWFSLMLASGRTIARAAMRGSRWGGGLPLSACDRVNPPLEPTFEPTLAASV